MREIFRLIMENERFVGNEIDIVVDYIANPRSVDTDSIKIEKKRISIEDKIEIDKDFTYSFQ